MASFYGCENDNFQMNNCVIFLMFAQNRDCEYMLEPPQSSTHYLCLRAKKENNVYPSKSQFYHIKVECTGSSLHGRASLINE